MHLNYAEGYFTIATTAWLSQGLLLRNFMKKREWRPSQDETYDTTSLILLILMSKKIQFQKAACNQHCLARAGFPILGCHLEGRRTLIESSTCLTPGTLRAAPSSCCRQFCKDEGIFISHISCNHFCHFVSGMYLNPHWTGGGPNGQCLLIRNEFIFQKQLWTFGSCKIYILIFLKYTCRELYCLEHGIHPDGMIPPVSRLLSNTTSWNIVRKRTTVN